MYSKYLVYFPSSFIKLPNNQDIHKILKVIKIIPCNKIFYQFLK